MDEQIRLSAALRLSSRETAERLGMPHERVKKRAARIGVRFGRYTAAQKNAPGGHRAADERSAELLRQAGVRI